MMSLKKETFHGAHIGQAQSIFRPALQSRLERRSPSSGSTDNEASECSAVTNLMTHSCWLWLTDGSKLAYLHLKAES